MTAPELPTHPGPTGESRGPRSAATDGTEGQESASQRLRRAADLIELRAALGPPLAAWLRTEANAGDLPPGVTRVVTATSVHAQTVADLILGGEDR